MKPLPAWKGHWNACVLQNILGEHAGGAKARAT